VGAIFYTKNPFFMALSMGKFLENVESYVIVKEFCDFRQTENLFP